MSNYVFYDFETSSSNKYWGQIIQIGAVLTNDNLDELDRFDARCRLSPGIIPEAMALIVNKSTPQMLKNSNLSHYQMIRQHSTITNTSNIIDPIYLSRCIG